MYELPKKMRDSVMRELNSRKETRNKSAIPESDPNHWSYNMPLFGQDKDDFLALQYRGKGE